MRGASQITGLIIFLFGITLLAFTYFLGYSLLTNIEILAEYAILIPLPSSGRSGELTDALVNAVGVPLSRLASYMVPVGFLFALGYVASKIAFHGIQMWSVRPAGEEKKGA